MTSPQPADPPRPGAPILRALAAQAVAGIVVFVGWQILAGGIDAPAISLLAVQGVLAAILGHFFGLGRWWLPINVLLPPGIVMALVWRLPAWVYLIAFLGLLGVFWNSVRGGVPLYLSYRRTKDAIAGMLAENGVFRFADLGCGLGGPVISLAQARPEGRFVGFETAPLLFAVARLRLGFQGAGNADIRFADIWSVDLGDFDVVYCFLSPLPMPALYDKARREMRPGSLLISNSFVVPDHPANEIVSVEDGRQTQLHLWRMGEKGEGG